jgi:hypothetical protein
MKANVNRAEVASVFEPILSASYRNGEFAGYFRAIKDVTQILGDNGAVNLIDLVKLGVAESTRLAEENPMPQIAEVRS